MEQQPHRAREWTKSNKKTQNKVTSYSNWPRVLLFDLAHKQCNGIIKGWLHCLTSDSKGGFISMPGHGPNPIFFNKKIKIGRPEHSLTLHPLRPITSHFCLNTSPPPSPPPPPQSGRHMCITRKLFRLCKLHQVNSKSWDISSLLKYYKQIKDSFSRDYRLHGFIFLDNKHHRDKFLRIWQSTHKWSFGNINPVEYQCL